MCYLPVVAISTQEKSSPDDIFESATIGQRAPTTKKTASETNRIVCCYIQVFELKNTFT